ncbi:hypothetical protein B0J13DRAFT_598880 [Dactylonectria estremocensis]|uniref:Fumarylacetoacetase-like C-terminal domain-containing protein n=1 Tax=Dactylonectria estremocensis TaxID=1079267 RepID=A0A9P9DTT7_9HYPO|nr:hypothetical protein B0J13DRAFT_598880 [Dactylonectria estremocensis]
METIFKRLVRFKDAEGHLFFGEASPSGSLIGSDVPVYTGDNPWSLQATSKTAKISEVLCPVSNVPILYGIGLNYKTHIAEAGWPTPQYPTVFTKPANAVNDPFADVYVNPACTNMDYEGELAVVIGQDCKNVSGPSDALSFVLGYTVANDISGQQHGYAKSFDGFAPIGPVIVSGDEVGNIDDLTIVTKVNGEERQRAKLDDLLFKVGDLIVHLSRGTTLKAGTVILTGTPGGVAAFMKPPAWLQDGDTVEVNVTNIGSIMNQHVFEK